MCERQVDLGMGQGLQPGALPRKDGPEASDSEVGKKDPGRGRRRTLKTIDATRALVPVDDGMCTEMVASLALSLQLDSALSEVEVLRQEVESYNKQVASKHSAIRILRQELKAAETQRDDIQERNHELQKDLTKEVNRLQFELEYSQNNLADSQQTWSQRFDRVCIENEKLQTAVNARDNELRFLVEERSALMRDRDELLALLDPPKRQMWCASSASTLHAAPLATIGEGENDIGLAPGGVACEGRGPIELAVLGACVCPGCSPCRCAQAAARLKRQVARSREEAAEARQRAEDAYVVVDAYRNAFEEQLTRNRALTLRMGQTAAGGGTAETRVGRLRELVRWVARQLHDLGGGGESRRGSLLLRRLDDVTAAEASSPGRSLSTSTWSMCESVMSGGQGPGDEEEEEEPGHHFRDLEPEPAVTERPQAGSGGLLAAARDLTDEQLTMLLLEKMCERAESVAHQRITARVLKRPGTVCGPKGPAASASSGVYSLSSS